MPPDVVCRITQSQPPPENTSVAPHPPQSEPIASENITAWVYERRARMLGARASRPHTAMRHLGTRASSPHTAIHHLGAQASRPHTAIHPITPAPPGCAGVSPACRVYRHCARIRRYTPSPLHRLGTRASRPHAGGRRRCACFFSPGCASVAPACRERGRLTCFFSPGSAGVSPACRIRERLARMPGARAFRPHAAMRPIRGRDALIPRRVCSPRCEQLHNPVLLFHCRDRAILRSDPGLKHARCCPNDHE